MVMVWGLERAPVTNVIEYKFGHFPASNKLWYGFSFLLFFFPERFAVVDKKFGPEFLKGIGKSTREEKS